MTDCQRRDIFTSLETTHGEEVANNIMQLLPNQPADQLVTRTDMHAFGAELRAELKGEMAELRGEMAELRSELKGEMAELRGEMVEFRAETRSDIATQFTAVKIETQRLIIAGMVANAAAVVTALLA